INGAAATSSAAPSGLQTRLRAVQFRGSQRQEFLSTIRQLDFPIGLTQPHAPQGGPMSAMRAIPIPEEAPSPQTYTAKAYAAQSPTSGVAAITIPRRMPQPKDLQIEILYCGV